MKNLPASAGDARAVSLIPESGRSPGGGDGNPLQYSCLENFMDRGAWPAIVQMVAELDTLTHTHTCKGTAWASSVFSEFRRLRCHMNLMHYVASSPF